MRTFTPNPDLAILTRWQIVKRLLVYFFIVVILKIGADWIFGDLKKGLSVELTSILIMAITYVLAYYFLSLRRIHKYVITLDAGHISGSYPVWLGTNRRTVVRKKIQTVIEREEGLFRFPGLLVSELGPVGTFLTGGVWIPRTVPEYEELKSLMLEWKSSRTGAACASPQLNS